MANGGSGEPDYIAATELVVIGAVNSPLEPPKIRQKSWSIYKVAAVSAAAGAAQGAYALSGQAVVLRVARSMTAGQGAYALAGHDVALRRAYTLAAGQ